MADINSLFTLADGNLTTNTTLLQCAPVCGNMEHALAGQALIVGLVLGAAIAITMYLIGRSVKNGWLSRYLP